MKKIWLLLITIGFGLGIYLLPKNQIKKPFPSKLAVHKTSQELWAERLVRKGKQKALGLNKFDHPNEFARYFKMIKQGEGEYQYTYSPSYRLEELEKARNARKKQAARTAAITWEERGPSNVPGRTRSLLIVPGDASGNTWMAGAVGGGIWKTTDAGVSWNNLTPDLANIAVSTLAMTADGNVIYAGTGESFAGDGIDGDGIFKSIDGGISWDQLPSTINTEDFGNVNRIIVDPNNSDLLLAATSSSSISLFASGIFRSTNGGSTWTKVYTGTAPVQQLLADPNDFSILYATVVGIGVIKSIDGGINWSNANNGMSPSGRTEIAISPVNSQRLFASSQGQQSGTQSDKK